MWRLGYNEGIKSLGHSPADNDLCLPASILVFLAVPSAVRQLYLARLCIRTPRSQIYYHGQRTRDIVFGLQG